MEYVSPFDDLARETVDPAPRLDSLSGRKIALLDINKARGDEFLDRMDELLRERGAVTVRLAKGSFSRPAAAAIIDEVVRPAGELRRGETTPLVKDADDDDPVHKWTAPERIELVVAGGEAGRFSAVLGPCDGMGTVPITKEIRWST